MTKTKKPKRVRMRAVIRFALVHLDWGFDGQIPFDRTINDALRSREHLLANPRWRLVKATFREVQAKPARGNRRKAK